MFIEIYLFLKCLIDFEHLAKSLSYPLFFIYDITHFICIQKKKKHTGFFFFFYNNLKFKHGKINYEPYYFLNKRFSAKTKQFKFIHKRRKKKN